MMMDFALQAVTRIINEGAYCNIAVNEVLQKPIFQPRKRLFTHIVLGTVENKIRIDYYLAPLIKGKRIKPYLKTPCVWVLYVRRDASCTSLCREYLGSDD